MLRVIIISLAIFGSFLVLMQGHASDCSDSLEFDPREVVGRIRVAQADGEGGLAFVDFSLEEPIQMGDPRLRDLDFGEDVRRYLGLNLDVPPTRIALEIALFDKDVSIVWDQTNRDAGTHHLNASFDGSGKIVIRITNPSTGDIINIELFKSKADLERFQADQESDGVTGLLQP